MELEHPSVHDISAIRQEKRRQALFLLIKHSGKEGIWVLQLSLRIGMAICLHPRDLSLQCSLHHASSMYKVRVSQPEIGKLEEIARISGARNFSSHYWIWLWLSANRSRPAAQDVPIELIRDVVEKFSAVQPSTMVAAWTASTRNDGANWESDQDSDASY